jgi:hypothetical protein
VDSLASIYPFRWQVTGRANTIIHASLITAKRSQLLEPITETDMRGRAVMLEIEPFQTPQALFLLFRPAPVRSKVRQVVALRR